MTRLESADSLTKRLPQTASSSSSLGTTRCRSPISTARRSNTCGSTGRSRPARRSSNRSRSSSQSPNTKIKKAPCTVTPAVYQVSHLDGLISSTGVLYFSSKLGAARARTVVLTSDQASAARRPQRRGETVTASTAAGNAGIGSWIERRARAAPDGMALIAGDCSLTYSELAGRVRQLANGLRTLGVAKGDRVAWLGPNH